MDFIINETGERKQVSCLVKNGTDVADDVAFTCGLLENNDVVWDEEENAYIAPEEVVEYWVEFFEIYGSCEEELDHLKDLYGDEAFKIYCFIAGEGGPMTRYGWNDGDGCSYYGKGSYSVTVAEAQKWFKERFGKESNDIR